MSSPTRRGPILVAALAALVIGLVAFLWLREGARDASARPEPTTVASEETSAMRAPTDALDAQRESLPLTEEAPVAEATPALEEDPEGPRVVVLVQDLDGVPIPGAEVEITAQGPAGTWKCGDDGRCKLPIEPWTGGVDLRVSADGFISNCIGVGRSEEIVVALVRSIAVRGRVVAADGGATVAGARVALGLVECDEPAPEVVADATGAFELAGVPHRQRIRCTVTAEGFAALERWFVVLDPALEIELELQRGRELELQVVDAQSGAPIEGARIVRDATEVATDAQGHVRTAALLSVHDVEAQLATLAPGYCSLWSTIRASEVDPAKPLQLPLLRGARLEGTVVDVEGQPLAEVEINVHVDFSARKKDPNAGASLREVELPEGWSLEGSRGGAVLSDANGRFAFDGLEPLSSFYRANLEREGIGFVNRKVLPELGPAGSTTQVQLVVDPAATSVIAGTMTLNGQPARGFVSWRGPTRGGGDLADLNGHYRLEGVEVGHVVLKPQPDGTGGSGDCDPFPGPWTVEARAGEEASLDFPLELEMTTIAGRVVDASGAPKADVGVLVMSKEACWRGYAPTKNDGTFEFIVRAGPWPYFAQAGRAPDQVRREGVLAGTRDLELELPGSGKLRLRAVDARDRTALTGFVLRLEDELGATRVVDTRSNGDMTPDPQGWYELALRPGTWKVFASDPDGERTTYLPVDGGSVSVQAGGEPQVLELERQRGLELDVQLAPGQEPWPADVFVLALEPATADQVVLDASGWNIGQAYRGVNVTESRALRLDANRRAHVTALRPGPHRLVAFPDTIAIEPSEVVVTGSESEPIEIRWKPR
jgi:protocatechuate 3,4-dioxygenase beta subunit